MPEGVGLRAAEFWPGRHIELARAENGVAASFVDRVAIVRRKVYRACVDLLRFISGLSSSWRSNTSKKNPSCMLCLHVYRFERDVQEKHGRIDGQGRLDPAGSSL